MNLLTLILLPIVDDLPFSANVIHIGPGSVVISLVEAFLILPSHLRHLEPRKNLHGLARAQQKIEHSIIDFAHQRFRPLLTWASQHRYLTASLFTGAFVISMGIFSSGWVKFYFMPQVESEQIYINVTLPTGTPYSRALEILEQLQEAELRLIDEVNLEPLPGHVEGGRHACETATEHQGRGDR